ncbi:MAG TPA: Qat anti-phage system QueC-like protein QatC [Vicinamibacterales bacterium]|jgi:7-cyano-7-deazaguanine synthase in queuosine biosynthesis|nr:Qat anti-phage system QueC-like protein QatC [Vicinamibacterales bacterium]
MKRHSTIARLGAADKAPVKVLQADSLSTEIRFVDGYRRLAFGLGQIIDQLIERGVVPSETAADLGILAATVTAADTRISRSADAQDGWTREIDIYLPVAQVTQWEALAPLLERTLKFLTGDHWRLFFRERDRKYKTLIQIPRTLIRPPFTSVCLFSGGLDSFIGAIDLFAGDERPILVSHYGDVSTSSQERCAERIAKMYGDMRPRHVRANVRFDRNDFAHEMGEEFTTRGRSFLFFALAALAASGLNRDSIIYVPENGLISLNVPLDRLRVGAWSTRTTHPFYMARWQEILDGLGIAARLENPYRFKTKGEMLAECRNQDIVRKHAADTISCSSPAKARWLGIPLGHCGFCVPCLIRRSAIASAFGKDPTTYTIPDLRARPLNARAAEGEHIRSFQMMARRLKRRPGLDKILVHKSGPLSDYDADEVAAYADVFTRGIEEVDTVTGKVVVRPE